MKLEGKVCVVTGAGRGIGREIASMFANEGARLVAACDINAETVNELSAEYPNVRGFAVDVTNPDQIQKFTEELKGDAGSIDVLVNNAGITADALVQKMTDEMWTRVIDINLKGVFNMTREIAPVMMEQGKGSIITISSVVGLDGNIGQSNYAATKAGVIGMTKTWAREFTRKGAAVRSNAVAPGYINTPMMQTVPEKIINMITGKTPLGRLGEPVEIAKAVTFLASDEASFINGQVLRVDGGLTL